MAADYVFSVCRDNINVTKMAEYFDIIYQTPWCRIGPYLVGMLLGYLLFITDGKMHMPRVGLFFLHSWSRFIFWCSVFFYIPRVVDLFIGVLVFLTFLW